MSKSTHPLRLVNPLVNLLAPRDPELVNLLDPITRFTHSSGEIVVYVICSGTFIARKPFDHPSTWPIYRPVDHDDPAPAGNEPGNPCIPLPKEKMSHMIKIEIFGNLAIFVLISHRMCLLTAFEYFSIEPVILINNIK